METLIAAVWHCHPVGGACYCSWWTSAFGQLWFYSRTCAVVWQVLTLFCSAVIFFHLYQSLSWSGSTLRDPDVSVQSSSAQRSSGPEENLHLYFTHLRWFSYYILFCFHFYLILFYCIYLCYIFLSLISFYKSLKVISHRWRTLSCTRLKADWSQHLTHF